MTRRIWLAVSGVLILLGVALFALQPGPPEPVCAADPNVTSGFTDPQQDCPISIDSMNAIRDYESAPKWFRVAGIVIASSGLILVMVVVVAKMRARPHQQS